MCNCWLTKRNPPMVACFPPFSYHNTRNAKEDRL